MLPRPKNLVVKGMNRAPPASRTEAQHFRSERGSRLEETNGANGEMVPGLHDRVVENFEPKSVWCPRGGIELSPSGLKPLDSTDIGRTRWRTAGKSSNGVMRPV